MTGLVRPEAGGPAKEDDDSIMILAFLGGLEVLLVFVLAGLSSLCCFVFWLWMLIDCLTNEGLPGSLIYFFIGRPKRPVK